MKLETHDVVLRFGEHRALDKVSLSVEGHCLALIGPSGGGKSTLLRVLAGLLVPESGSVSVNNAPLPANEKTLRIYRRSIGTVFQSFNLFPHLTVLRNIVLPLTEVHRWDAEKALARAETLLERFGLADHAWKKPAQLSGGQRQRVAIIRAVAPGSKLLFLDEPTSALDPEMTAGVLGMLVALKSEGTDLVLVTHQMGFAREVADSTIFLSAGRVVETGPQLFTHPKEAAVHQFLEKVLRY